MLIGQDISRALDPVLFAADCGFVCDPWQARLLRDQSKRCLILASRQVGKSTTTGLLALHTALYTSGALIVVVSPSQRQSNEFVRSVRLMHQRLEDAAPLKTESVTRLEFENDSRILSLPGGEDGKTIRGLAGARLIVADEAARIPDSLVTAIRPMMATNREAAFVALSTPAGKSGFFHDAWHSLDDTWVRIKVSALDCPRISPAFLEEERRSLGQTAFESEYGLIFHDDVMAAFPSNIIAGIFDTELQPLWPN